MRLLLGANNAANWRRRLDCGTLVGVEGQELRVLYVLSDQFDYGRLICDDAGPAFARRQRWGVIGLSALQTLRGEAVPVVDSRLTPGEFDSLLGLADAGESFALRVVDLWENEGSACSQFALRAASNENVRFCGPYLPTGLAQKIIDRYGPSKYYWLPYAYDPNRELPLGGRRSGRLPIVGRRASFYPHRTRLWNEVGRRPWLRPLVNRLDHPGYPDVGEDQQHNVVGDGFLRFLAEHRACFLDSGRANAELLRYCECAYAGCAPVGFAPASFGDDLRSQFVQFDPAKPEASFARLRTIPVKEMSQRAIKYRSALAAARRADDLTAGLLRWWVTTSV